MARANLASVTEQARRFPGLTVVASIDCGGGAGFLITTRGDSGAVLGVGAIDLIGDHAAVGLNVAEVRELRDALNDWLYETTGFRQD
jgi:hypothetical protein